MVCRVLGTTLKIDPDIDCNLPAPSRAFNANQWILTDDILIFSETAEGAALLLDALITTLDKTGLKLNASKTIILTTEAQPQDHITTPAGHTIVVKDSFGTHKWLGCMLSALGSGNVDADIAYHLQAAARAFHSNKLDILG